MCCDRGEAIVGTGGSVLQVFAVENLLLGRTSSILSSQTVEFQGNIEYIEFTVFFLDIRGNLVSHSVEEKCHIVTIIYKWS